MNTLFRAFGWLAFWLLIFAGGFLLVVWFGSFSPNNTTELPVGGAAQMIRKDSLKILAWNIGYAGLGDDMDFFYDGGQSVRTSYGRTLVNLDSICRLLKRHNDADFILLQEVDLNSKRSFGINQYDSILRALGAGWQGYVGLNYVSPYVPYPLGSPMGAVRSGVVTFTRHVPRRAVRYSYPGGPSWPVSMFDLKRCLLVLEFPLADSGAFYVANTHNSAYDDGGVRMGELAFLRSMFERERDFLVAGDWNAIPPGYQPSAGELDDPYFSPLPMDDAALAADWAVGYDRKRHTLRYGYEPYNKKTTTRTTVDFMVAGPGIEILSTRCIDLKFRNSDHQPVRYTVRLRR